MKKTIAQFLEANRKEWNEFIKDAHPDDQLSFQDWLSELHPRSILNDWGIVKDTRTDEWKYDESNSNWEGDDICDCCGGYYDAEPGEDLCEICNEDKFSYF